MSSLPENSKLRIGVLGAGHLGRIHIKEILASPMYHLAGYFDPNVPSLPEFGLQSTALIEELMARCDVVDIVAPTVYHHELALLALEEGKHIFIEKPIADEIGHAVEISLVAQARGLKVQVGHVERFNPAFVAAQPYIHNPMFIEAQRIAEFKPRGTDVSVVLDLMIHDIDLVLSMVDAQVDDVRASGIAVVNEDLDIANARIEFANGCVANLTASRMSMKNERKLRLFQKDRYLNIDLLNKNVSIFSMSDAGPNADPRNDIIIDPGQGLPRRMIEFDQPKVETFSAIRKELEAFAASIIFESDTEPDAEQATAALSLAFDIQNEISRIQSKARW